MARAAGAFLYWHGAEALPSAVWQAWRGICDLTIFGSEQAALGRTDGVVRHSFRLGTLRRAEREAIWKHVSNEPAPSMVQDRLLSVGEIALVARAAPGGHAAMQQACRGFLEPFSDILQPVACPFSWDDLVLAPDVRRQLEEFEQQARLRWPVYEEWGFERLCPSSKGIAAMFAGPSGTGKTMAAQVIARSIGLELYRVDLSGVMNKYIGETEKRLRQVFDHCERASVVLFFDEADALFGQRTQTKDAHDRFANIQVDYLLQRMEQYDGIAILATNRKNDVDKAFLRRLRFSIDFLAPGPEERLALWQRALLPESPSGEPLLDAIDWRFLAEKLALSGADIKTAALGAAFLARAEETRIGMRHVLAAAKREMLKQGAVLRTNS
jgi:hypothetical protein